MSDPILATLARLVDHERWPFDRSCYEDRAMCGPRWRDEDTGILWRWHADAGRWLPDPDDAATGGVLLSLLVGSMQVQALGDGETWEAWSILGRYPGPTLGRACVAALAAAWGVE